MYKIIKKLTVTIFTSIVIIIAFTSTVSRAYEQDTINSELGKPPIIDLKLPTGWEMRSSPVYNSKGEARGMFEYNSTHIFVDYYSKKKLKSTSELSTKPINTNPTKPNYYIISAAGHNGKQSKTISINNQDLQTAQYIYIPSQKLICSNDNYKEVGNDWFESRYNSYYYYFQSQSQKNVTINEDIVQNSIQEYKNRYSMPISREYDICWNKYVPEQELSTLDTYSSQDKLSVLFNNDFGSGAVIQFKVCTSESNRDFNANVNTGALEQIRDILKTIKGTKNDSSSLLQDNTKNINQDDPTFSICDKFYLTSELPQNEEELLNCFQKNGDLETETNISNSELKKMIKVGYDNKELKIGNQQVNLYHNIIDAIPDSAIPCLFDEPDNSRLESMKQKESEHQTSIKSRDSGIMGIYNIGYFFGDRLHDITNYDYLGSIDNIVGYIPIVGELYDGYRSTSGNSIAGKVSCADRIITGAFTTVASTIAFFTAGTASIASKFAKGAIKDIINNTGQKITKQLIRTQLQKYLKNSLSKTIQAAITGTITSKGIELLLAGILSPDNTNNNKSNNLATTNQDLPDNVDIYDQSGDFKQTIINPYYEYIGSVDTSDIETSIASIINNSDILQSLSSKNSTNSTNTNMLDILSDLLTIKAYANSKLYIKSSGGYKLVTRLTKNKMISAKFRHGVKNNYYNYTDNLGRLTRAKTNDLQLDPSPRANLPNNQTPGKTVLDDAGHLIADIFGGNNKLANLISMSSNINRVNGEFYELEKGWKKALKESKKVAVDIQVKHNNNELRPSEFIVRYWIDGKEQLPISTIKN
jgi:hypothetical protein